MYKRSQVNECDMPGMLKTMPLARTTDFPSRVMVVSPHTDDAAFSLAATLKLLASAGSSVRIINCFTLGRFAPFAPANDRISVVTRRRQEEECFLYDLGGDSRSDDLGLVDAPVRTGLGARGLLVRDPSSPDITETVSLLVDHLEAAGDDTAVLAPLAIGGHRDHYIARQAALARYKARPIAFYEDLPYASGARKDQIETAFREVGSELDCRLRPLLIHWPGDSEWKQECCSHYKSQISTAGIQNILNYMTKISGERLWCSDRFASGWQWQSTRRPAPVLQEPYFV